MATVTDNFTITRQTSGQVIAKIKLEITNENGNVIGASGTIYEKSIDGLSNYLNSSNTVYESYRFGSHGTVQYAYNFKNISISTGGFNYNITGNGQLQNQTATINGSDNSQIAGTTNSDMLFLYLLCFVAGTQISTMRGNVAVEDLRIGDQAVTASGALRPVVWIGHRAIDGAGVVLIDDQQPIRIRAEAFGPGLPVRDLRLSPGHPVLERCAIGLQRPSW